MSKTKNATLALSVQKIHYASDTWKFRFDYFCPFCAELNQAREICKKQPKHVGYVLDCSISDMINIYFPKEK